MGYINAYRSHSVGGQGLVLAIPKEENQELVKAYESGRETWIEVLLESGESKFLGHHVSQEELEISQQREQDTFLQEISKPYHPKKEMKAYAKTIGDLPFQEGMSLVLLPSDKMSYAKTLGYPVVFNCSELPQQVLLTQGKTTSTKIIRAVLTGYDVSALVIAPYSNKSLILDNGELKKHHGAEILVSFAAGRT